MTTESERMPPELHKLVRLLASTALACKLVNASDLERLANSDAENIKRYVEFTAAVADSLVDKLLERSGL